MTDTEAWVAQLVTDRHRLMTPGERCAAASSLFDVARAFVEASLPHGLTDRERRFAVARRLYGRELSDAALAAHAEFDSRLK